MIKFILALIVLIGLAIGGLMFFGYEFHPENFKYYIPEKSAASVYQIEFSNGRTMTGKMLKETDESIQINANGIISNVPKSQIKSSKEIKTDMVSGAMDNIKHQHRLHPLLTKGKQSAASSMDESSTSLLKTLSGMDKLEQMEKMKKKIEDISKIQDERNKQAEDLMTFTGN